mgnify:CR=1 FL=1
MKVVVDFDASRLQMENGDEKDDLDLYGKEAFERLSELWLKLSWEQKYPYTFAWLGRPIIQHPEDMVRIQDLIFREQPDIIIETGVAHGGSLIYYASIMKMLGKGKVIGVDIEIRPHNREAIEAHPMKPLITLIEGNSVGDDVLNQVRSEISPGDKVMVILDSDHSRKHVLAELEAYHDFVTPGSWMLVQDGIMKLVHDVPRGTQSWDEDNPISAVNDFLKSHDNFDKRQPDWSFNESNLTNIITAHPEGWLWRTS